jgi:hypothetical protein
MPVEHGALRVRTSDLLILVPGVRQGLTRTKSSARKHGMSGGHEVGIWPDRDGFQRVLEATGRCETRTMWVRPQTPAEFRRHVRPSRPVELPDPLRSTGESGLRSLSSGVKVCEVMSVCRWSGRAPLGRASTSLYGQSHLLSMRPGVGVRRRVPLWRGSRCSIRMRCGLLG